MTHTACFTATFGLLLATAGFVEYVGRAPATPLDRPLDSISRELAGWRVAEELRLEDSALTKLQPTDYLSRVYEGPRGKIGLFVAYYARQRAGESMHSPMVCLPGSGWEIWDYGKLRVPVDGLGEVTVNRVNIQSVGERRVVLYWYQSGRSIIASEFTGKLVSMRDALLRHRAAGAIVRLTMADTPDAIRNGTAFAAAAIPQVLNCEKAL